MTRPRMLVTGRHGQVATALAELGDASGFEIRCAGRPELDLERPANIWPCVAAYSPDIIVNAAAWTAVDKAEAEPERCLAANAAGARAVAEAASRLGVPIIQISTDYVFDGSPGRPWREEDLAAPLGVYGRSKLDGERAVAGATADHVILRTSWVFSATGQNFVRTMLRLAATRSEIAVVDDQIGLPTYAPDLAVAIAAIGRNLLASPGKEDIRGILHAAGGGTPTSWAGFAKAIFAEAEPGASPVAIRPITTSEYPTPARRPANSVLDTSRLAGRHGVVMPDWRDSLRRCLARLAQPQAKP